MPSLQKDLERIADLQHAGRAHLEAGRLEEALDAAEQALALEAQNVRSLMLKADVLERMGQAEAATQLRALAKQIKREAWQREVEAEARGQHDLMGEAIRHENF